MNCGSLSSQYRATIVSKSNASIDQCRISVWLSSGLVTVTALSILARWINVGLMSSKYQVDVGSISGKCRVNFGSLKQSQTNIESIQFSGLMSSQCQVNGWSMLGHSWING